MSWLQYLEFGICCFALGFIACDCVHIYLREREDDNDECD